MFPILQGEKVLSPSLDTALMMKPEFESHCVLLPGQQLDVSVQPVEQSCLKYLLKTEILVSDDLIYVR